MKNFFYLVMFILIFVLPTSCKQDDFEPEDALVRTDNPPSGLFASDIDYGQYIKVYVEKSDVDNIKYYGNFVAGNNVYFDVETGQRTESFYSYDFYKISAKKYYGLYKFQTYISNSAEFYIISSYDLEQLKKVIERKSSAICCFSGPDIHYQWKTISGAE